MYRNDKEHVAWRARFAGLGLTAFATLAIVTAAPRIALAEGGSDLDDDMLPASTLVSEAPVGEGVPTDSDQPVLDDGQGTIADGAQTQMAPETEAQDASGDLAARGATETAEDGTDVVTEPQTEDAGETQSEQSTDEHADEASQQDEGDETVPADGPVGVESSEGAGDAPKGSPENAPATDGAEDEDASADEAAAAEEASASASAKTEIPTTDVASSVEKKPVVAMTTSAKATVAAARQATAAKASTRRLAAAADPLDNWKNGKWVVLQVSGQTRRYWRGEDGTMYKGGVIDPTWGMGKNKAGFWAFASPKTGYAVISRYATTYKGKRVVFLADATGKLTKGAGGWVVTGKFTNGVLQRYYVDPDLHGAVVGYAKKKGSVYAHYTLANVGYVLRTAKKMGKRVYIADNDGKLLTGTGWKTSKVSGTKRRYYLKGAYATAGLFSVGEEHYYGTKKGYVITTPTKYGKGYMIPDKTGALRWKKGWYVGGKYNNGNVERYYFADVNNNGIIETPAGLFKAKLNGKTHIFYGTNKGYVLRDDYVATKSYYYIANGETGAMTRTKAQPLNGRQQEALQRANGESSSTKYLITIDQRPGQYWLYVWQKYAVGVNKWRLVKETRVGVGTDETPTYNGRSTVVTSATRRQLTPGSDSVIWATAFQGGGWHMHSTVNPYSSDWQSQVGRKISHGCVRMFVNDAKWIYDNIGLKANGTKVYVYGGNFSQ